ncbi:MAG: hypothetical protein AABW46_04385 [Nanoarchaeota archaeon]
MDNKRWYFIFSGLVFLMVLYTFFVISEELSSDGWTINVSSGTINVTSADISAPFENGSSILASEITLNITFVDGNGSSNQTWYLYNSSDGNLAAAIVLNISAEAANETDLGTFDLANGTIDLNSTIAADSATVKTYYIQTNLTNTTILETGYNIDSNFVQILALKIYPNALVGEPFNNGTVNVNGYSAKGGTDRLNNITEQANLSSTVLFNASVAAGNTTTNVTWYVINGSTEIILGSLHEIGNTTLEFDTGNGTLSDGTYNLTLSYTNATIGDGVVYDAANSFNTTVLNLNIDNTAPSLVVELPVNNSNLTTTVIDLNFTASDAATTLGSCWYNLNFASSNTTVADCSNITFTALDGRNNITLYANDSVDNLNTSLFIEFSVDLTHPSATVTLSDSDGIIYTRSTQKVKCDFDEGSGGTGLDNPTRKLQYQKPNGDILSFEDEDAAQEQTFKEIDTATTGDYTVRCSVSDVAGLTTTAEKTFRVHTRGGPSSATSGGGGGTAVEGVEGGEDTGEAAPSEPSESGAPTTGIGGPTPSVSAPGGAGGTVAIVIIVIVIAAGVIYFLVKGKPGKKGQIKFSRSELLPKRM